MNIAFFILLFLVGFLYGEIRRLRNKNEELQRQSDFWYKCYNEDKTPSDFMDEAMEKLKKTLEQCLPEPNEVSSERSEP